jgi:MFS family permease
MADLEAPTVQPADAGPDAGQPARRSAMLIVFLVVFIDLLGFGIVLPLLPQYGKTYLEPLFPRESTTATTAAAGNRSEEDEEHLSILGGVVLGLILSSFSAMQFLFAPSWGRLSDRIGRRPVLLVGLGGSVIFYALFGYASSLGTESAVLVVVLLFVARLGAGVAGATISTAQAVIADCTPPEKRKHGMAMIGAAFGIGFTFGPLLGAAALAIDKDFTAGPGYMAAFLSLVALLLGLRLLPETRTAGVPTTQRRVFDLQSIRNTLRNPAVGVLVLIFFLATFGFGSFEATLALFNKATLHLDPKHNYLVFAYVGFVLMMVQGFLYRRLARRFSEVTFITIGIVLMGLGVGSLGGPTVLKVSGFGSIGLLWAWIMVGLAVAVTGFGFLTPSIQALISRRTDPNKQGEILGVNQSASALARILGPFVGLSLFHVEENHLLPYGFGAGLILIMLPLLPKIREPDSTGNTATPGG